MDYEYSLAHIDFSAVSSKQELLALFQSHDRDSYVFCENTGQINMAIGKELGFVQEELFLLLQCGIFHDIGKLGMSQAFINYPEAYTIQMYGEMKKHTAGGGMLLEAVSAEKELIDTARFHHCNFDGSGYPGGYFYHEIPMHARITRIADSVDAYMSKRCYKEGGPSRAVLDDLRQYRGTSYDPDFLDAFSRVHTKIMDRCHRLGQDHPSQHMYMHALQSLYGDAELLRFRAEVVC